jgi:small subunit ribosomal protein S19
MTRSLKKGPFVDEKLYRKAVRAKETGSHAPIRTWSRRCTIVPEFVGVNFEIHNGKVFHKLFVTEEMVGHKLGEFSPTRTFRGHGGRTKAASAGPAPAPASGGAAKAPAGGK